MVRATALALTALTGASALVYEVAWQKYVATLLGSHSEATAAVLALFLGGLSAGYALFGRLTRRLTARAADRAEPPRLLLVYGAVEVGIGVHAFLFPWLFAGVRALSLAIPHRVSGPGFALDVALVALLILPPTVLMGGTIPLLTQALARSLADATRVHALVYSFNTAGAFVGALLAGFALVPQLGLARVVLAMGAVNGVAGLLFTMLGWRHRSGLEATEPEGGPEARLGVLALVALFAGFAAMALQTVLIRVAGLSIGSSEFTFSMVVAVFVLCIALGSFAVSALPRIPSGLLVGVQCALALLLCLLYAALPNAPYWVYVVRSAFRDEATSFTLYYGTLFLGLLGVLAIPVGLSGATLPLMFHQLRREMGGLGSAAGRLYAWNTVGSLLGALLGGYLLLFWLDLDRIYAIAVGAVVASAVLLAIRLFALPPATAVVLAPLLLVLGLLPPWDRDRLASGLFRERTPAADSLAGPDAFFDGRDPNNHLRFYDDDPSSSVAVYETRFPGGSASDLWIATNGKPDGSILMDYPTMALVALLPALFAEQPENAFVIGFGTGVSVGELAALDPMRNVMVAEISPGVIDAASLFEARNQHALASPKTEVIVADAFRALLRSGRRFDLIVSEPSNPWVSGVEMLFSREFLEAARDALRPGGVHAQWFHLYETDDEVVELVLRTYAAVFDHVAVWYTLGTDLVLLGFESDSHVHDLDRLRERAARPDFAAGLRRAGIEGLPALLAHEVLPVGVLHAAHLEGDIHTLLHPVLNHRAARAFFAGRLANLPPMLHPSAAEIGAENSLLDRYRRDRGGRLSDAEHREIAHEFCKERPSLCAVRMASWKRDVPLSEVRDEMLAELRAKPAFTPHLAPDRLDALVFLLGRERLPDERSRGRRSVQDARQLTDLFVHYYHHGSAFDRTTLADVWRRCQDGGGGVNCSATQVEVERRIGPLR